MIDTDKELEWIREDREDRHIGSISKHECVVDVAWVEELLKEVKRLREGIKAYLELDIETHELKALISEMIE
tara:strand:+ start:375 stop:590 length:216 start_codon:yes stop_codon:yes gene_type:complete